MGQATRDAEQLVEAYVKLWNDRDYAQIPDLVSESFVVYNAALPDGEARGHDGLEAWIREVTTGFPDFQIDVRDLVASEDTVMTEVTYTMTHEGEFGDIPPTGREVELPGMTKFRVEDGKLYAQRDYYDQQDFFDQLGVTDADPDNSERPPATATSAEYERLAREHFDRVWNQGEFDTAVLADEYRVHLDLGGHETYPLEEFREFVTKSREAIPDLRKEPTGVFATDEKVTIQYTVTGTQEGEFKGIPGTGEEVEINAVAIYRLEDGKLAESWIVADFLRALTQLGVVELPGE